VLVSVPEEMDSVLSDLKKLLGGWENMYQLLRGRRNACAAETDRLYIPRAQLFQRLEQEAHAIMAEDWTIYGLPL
jgi:hypothetical protein